MNAVVRRTLKDKELEVQDERRNVELGASNEEVRAVSELDNAQLRRMRILDGGVGAAVVLLYVLALDWVPERFLDIAIYMSQGLIFFALGIGTSQIVLLRRREGYTHIKRWAWALIALGLVHPILRVGVGVINYFAASR